MNQICSESISELVSTRSELLRFMSLFSRQVLARRLLSFIPMARVLVKNKSVLSFERIAGFGSGSGFMEIALSLLLETSEVFMFDEKNAMNQATNQFISEKDSFFTILHLLRVLTRGLFHVV